MNISSISVSNLCNINCNKQKNVVGLNKQLATDCFVKSSNVSFSALNPVAQRQQKIDSFVSDLFLKVRSPKFSIRDISDSFQKHVKNVYVKPMNQAPKELLYSASLQGLYCEELGFDETSNRFLIPKKNRVFYTRTETLNKDLGNIWCSVNAAHELTHALQTEAADSKQLDLFNTYIENNKKDIDSAINQVTAVVQTINPIEENIARPFIDLLVQNEQVAYNRVQDGYTNVFGWLCKKGKIDNFDAYVREKVNESIKTSEKEHNIKLDKPLLFDATINLFEKEIEAYANEGRAFKRFIGFDSPRALARVQIYQKSIDILKEMKKEVE